MKRVFIKSLIIMPHYCNTLILIGWNIILAYIKLIHFLPDKRLLFINKFGCLLIVHNPADYTNLSACQKSPPARSNRLKLNQCLMTVFVYILTYSIPNKN